MNAPEAGDSPLEAYGAAIEDLFIRRRGTPFLLSAKDWSVLRGWYEAGVPVRLVCQVLNDRFDRRETEGKKGKVSSLRYFSDAVEVRWAEWLESRAGSASPSPGGVAGEPPQPQAGRLLERMAAAEETLSVQGRAGLAMIVGRARRQIGAELADGVSHDIEAAERGLARIETQMFAELLGALDPADRTDLESAVTLLLAPYASAMEEGRYRATFTAGIRQALRQRFILPILSLLAE